MMTDPLTPRKGPTVKTNTDLKDGNWSECEKRHGIKLCNK